MNTDVIRQEFFVNDKNEILCIDIMLMTPDNWMDSISDEWAPITKDKAEKIANPPATKEQLVEQAEAQKQHMITEVNAETQLLQTKLALGRIKDDEKALLNAWLDYLDELEAVDTSTAPDITWPVKP